MFIDVKDKPAPKDGSLLILLVKLNPDTENWYPTEDSHIFRTIGFNSLIDTEEDVWQCAGWCWCNDHFTDASNIDTNTDIEVLGWLPLPENNITKES